MGWVAGSMIVLGTGVVVLAATIERIGRCRDESELYVLSVRFWTTLALVGVILFSTFAPPLLALAVHENGLGALTLGLVSFPIAVVIAIGTRNAATLQRAHRRRHRVLGEGIDVQGVVVDRRRCVFGQDLMRVCVDADVPVPEPRPEIGYRLRNAEATVRRRFVEVAPGDHFERFPPGARVTLRIDPAQPQARYALLGLATSMPSTPLSA